MISELRILILRMTLAQIESSPMHVYHFTRTERRLRKEKYVRYNLPVTVSSRKDESTLDRRKSIRNSISQRGKTRRVNGARTPRVIVAWAAQRARISASGGN